MAARKLQEESEIAGDQKKLEEKRSEFAK